MIYAAVFLIGALFGCAIGIGTLALCRLNTPREPLEQDG